MNAALPVGRLVLEHEPNDRCPHCNRPLTALTDTATQATFVRCPRCQTTTRSPA